MTLKRDSQSPQLPLTYIPSKPNAEKSDFTTNVVLRAALIQLKFIPTPPNWNIA